MSYGGGILIHADINLTLFILMSNVSTRAAGYIVYKNQSDAKGLQVKC